MIFKIIIGILLGLITYFFFDNHKDENEESKNILLTAILIIDILFIGSSFAYGAIYGAMAIAEILIGIGISYKIFNSDKKKYEDLLGEIDQTERNIKLYDERIAGYIEHDMPDGEKNMIRFRKEEEKDLKSLRVKAAYYEKLLILRGWYQS